MDLPGGAQPMSDEDGAIWVIFNGEIYNHAELRRELEARGHRFRTDHSDTEVIVHASASGASTASRASAACSRSASGTRARSELWLVRDRIGIKPLYYSVHHGRLVFASEIKALLEDPRAGARESTRRRSSTTSRSSRRPAPQTLFKGIRKLPGGTLAARRRRTARSRSGATGTSGTHASRSRASRGRDRRARARRAAHVRAAAQGQRRAGRRVPLRRHRLEHERRAVLRGRGAARSRRSRSATTATTTSTRTSCTTRARWRERVGAEHHEMQALTQDDLIDFLPRDGASCRTSRSPTRSACPSTTCRSSRASNGVIVARSARAPTSCSGATRPGRRCSDLQRSTTLPVPASFKALGRRSAVAPPARSSVAEVEFLRARRAGQPMFWGGAEAFTERRSSACSRRACASGSRASRRGTRWGRSTRAPARTRENRRPELDELPRPQPAPARAAADARRQDDDGRQPRGARAVPRPQVRRARDVDPRRGQDARRHAEAHPQEGGARRHPRRADRPAEAGLRRPGPRVVLRACPAR